MYRMFDDGLDDLSLRSSKSLDYDVISSVPYETKCWRTTGQMTNYENCVFYRMQIRVMISLFMASVQNSQTRIPLELLTWIIFNPNIDK